MPGRGNKVVHIGIVSGPQRAREGFCLVKVTHPIVTPMHDVHRDLLQPMNMVEDVIIVAVRLAAATKKAAVQHVVD